MSHKQMRDYTVKKAFGLDLAGYATGQSALARATVNDDGPPTVTILTDSLFSCEIHGADNLPAVCATEVGCLQAMLKEGPLFIDVPIDLQRLLAPQNPRFVWQLTKRAVDQAFGGLPPLAVRQLRSFRAHGSMSYPAGPPSQQEITRGYRKDRAGLGLRLCEDRRLAYWASGV
jgi:hypothetical protein